jgi:hypothetical protein
MFNLKNVSKMKNKLMITLIMCSITIVSFGQDRINREKLSFIDKSEQLTSAVGWSYNKTLGEWIDYMNVISNDKSYKDKFKSLQGSYMMSRLKQNFISIQTKTVVYKDVKYYVLCVEKWNGDYKYPNIKEDWRIYKTMFGYVFTEQEYTKLKNIKDNVNLETKYMVSMGSHYEKYDETIFLDKIQTELSSEKLNRYDPIYTFPIKKTENDNVRFYMLDYFSKYSLNQVDFDKEYFETSLDNFSKFIIK